MNLSHLNDRDLLAATKSFAHAERQLVVKILHHLREIERRRLFSDLGYRSLFEYAVRELNYSEGQASRRIQTMRLIKVIPEVESKIASGALSLSNIQSANTLFRNLEASNPECKVTVEEKKDVLSRLEGKSAREGEAELLKINPDQARPKERERVLKEDATEVRFIVSDALKKKLEVVRSLLGVAGATMSYADLLDAMADASVEALKEKRFGKKRSQAAESVLVDEPVKESISSNVSNKLGANVRSTSRYIPSSVKHQVWTRDTGQCCICKGQRNLNFDHIQPLALRNATSVENLRLLCIHCNQRARDVVFGMRQQESAFRGSIAKV